MFEIKTIGISTLSYSDPLPGEYAFSTVDIHILKDGENYYIGCIYHVKPRDMRGLLELQFRLLNGEKVYLTGALAEALGIQNYETCPHTR